MTEDEIEARGEALEALAEGPAQRAAEAIEAVFERTGRSIEDNLERAARNGEASFARLTESILRDLARLAAEQLIAKPLDGFLASALDGLDFAGGRAEGGPVMTGQSYWVGERGPELFTPHQAGQIGEAAGSSITVNVTLPSGGGGAPVSEAAISRAVASAVRRAERWS